MYIQGLAARARQRYEKQHLKEQQSGVTAYQQQLKQLVNASGDGKSHRQGSQKLDFKLREGEVYAFYCPDNQRYYRTVYLKRLGIDQVLKPMISNPVYGDIPETIPEINPEQIYQNLRMHNMTSLNAFTTFDKGITAGGEK